MRKKLIFKRIKNLLVSSTLFVCCLNFFFSCFNCQKSDEKKSLLIHKYLNPDQILNELKLMHLGPVGFMNNLTKEFENTTNLGKPVFQNKPRPPDLTPVNDDDDFLIIDANKGPPSFSILMNFQPDGKAFHSKT
jgi:hypothetical protein